MNLDNDALKNEGEPQAAESTSELADTTPPELEDSVPVERQSSAMEVQEPSAAPIEVPEPEEEPADSDEPLLEDDEAEFAEFDSLIGDYLGKIVQHEISSIIKVRVVEVHSDHVLVDMGDKAEGIVDINEFFDSKGNINICVGDEIDVLIEGREEETGLIELSHTLARAKRAWTDLEQAFKDKIPVSGVVTRAVRSGLLVDIGVEVFMPASQIDSRRVENLEDWVGREVEAAILDLDTESNRAVLSRRKLVEEAEKKAFVEALEKLKEGTSVVGKVRSIHNFGAFFDLDGVDAFMPREEISYDRGVAIEKYFVVGDNVKVQIVNIDRAAKRVKVSRRALRPDPWATVGAKYQEGALVRGEVVSVTRFGAFVSIEEGLTGLIHVRDLSWEQSPQDVSDHVKEGDTVRAQVLSIDVEKRRLGLGLKQLVDDPWIEMEKVFPKGSKVKGTVSSLVSFGAFVKLNDQVEGLIHISEFSWDKMIKHPGEMLEVGQEVEAVVLKTDRNTRRIALGIRQLTESRLDAFLRDHKVGSEIEGVVSRMIPVGAFVTLVPAAEEGGRDIDGFLHISQIDRERIDKPEDKLSKGQQVRCKITKVDKGASKISLSIKELLEDEERDAIRQFQANAEDSTPKLGDLFKGLKLGS